MGRPRSPAASSPTTAARPFSLACSSSRWRCSAATPTTRSGLGGAYVVSWWLVVLLADAVHDGRRRRGPRHHAACPSPRATSSRHCRGDRRGVGSSRCCRPSLQEIVSVGTRGGEGLDTLSGRTEAFAYLIGEVAGVAAAGLRLRRRDEEPAHPTSSPASDSTSGPATTRCRPSWSISASSDLLLLTAASVRPGYAAARLYREASAGGGTCTWASTRSRASSRGSHCTRSWTRACRSLPNLHGGSGRDVDAPEAAPEPRGAARRGRRRQNRSAPLQEARAHP